MWWDERSAGGRLKALIFLLHPGPSLLVTAVFVAIAILASGHVPGPVRIAQLAGIMLPIQFAIGIANDLCDQTADAASQPYKPLVQKAVTVRAALGAAAVLAAGGLVAAATVSLPVLALAACGLAAGLAYDLGLGRTPLSLLPWWVAFAVLPLAAFVAAGRTTTPWLYLLIPLSGLLALSLHLANGAPDVETDRAAGRRSLPVLLGVVRARALSLAALAAAAVVATDLAGQLGQRFVVVIAGAAFALLVVAVAALKGLRRPFPALAPAGAVLAVTWLAALPVS